MGGGGAAAESAPSPRRVRLKEKLRELKECFDEGLLSHEEHAAEKAKLQQAAREEA